MKHRPLCGWALGLAGVRRLLVLTATICRVLLCGPRHVLVAAGKCPGGGGVGGSSAACLAWGLAELCLFLFSKQCACDRQGRELLKTHSEVGIEPPSRCQSPLEERPVETGLAGVRQAPSQLGALPGPEPQQILGLGLVLKT